MRWPGRPAGHRGPSSGSAPRPAQPAGLERRRAESARIDSLRGREVYQGRQRAATPCLCSIRAYASLLKLEQEQRRRRRTGAAIATAPSVSASPPPPRGATVRQREATGLAHRPCLFCSVASKEPVRDQSGKGKRWPSTYSRSSLSREQPAQRARCVLVEAVHPGLTAPGPADTGSAAIGRSVRDKRQWGQSETRSRELAAGSARAGSDRSRLRRHDSPPCVSPRSADGRCQVATVGHR
jgi:hypothetical protein